MILRPFVMETAETAELAGRTLEERNDCKMCGVVRGGISSKVVMMK